MTRRDNDRVFRRPAGGGVAVDIPPVVIEPPVEPEPEVDEQGGMFGDLFGDLVG